MKETQRHKLGKLLGKRTRNLLLMSATPHNDKEADFQLADDALPHLGSWKADTGLLHRIVDAIEELRPRVVVELGSGASSLVCARALELNGGGRLVSYDQHAPFVEATAHIIGAMPR